MTGKAWRDAGESRGPSLRPGPHLRRAGSRPRLIAALIPLAVGLGLIVSAAPAMAATGSFSSPGQGMIYDGVSTNQTSVSLLASETYGFGESGTLTLDISDPRYALNHADGCQWQVDSEQYGGFLASGSVTTSGTVDLTSKTYPASCSTSYAGQLPVNGTWTASLVDANDTASPTRTFVVRIAPAVPTGLSGTSPAPLQETIGWVRNPELDTHLYEVLAGNGNSLGSFPANQACNSTTCSATVTVAGSGSQSFQVEAFRRTAPTSDVNDPSTAGDLATKSAPASFTVQAGTVAATPGPTGTGPTGTGSTGTGSTGSNATGKATIGKATVGKATTGAASAKPTARSERSAAPVAPKAPTTGAPVLGHTLPKGQATKLSGIFKNFVPPAGLDKLPPLPVLASAAPVAPGPGEAEPTDQGTFKRKLGYAPQSTTIAVTTTTVPLSSVADAIGVTPAGLWRSVAGSLLLLLGAAHVRRFAKAAID